MPSPKHLTVLGWVAAMVLSVAGVTLPTPPRTSVTLGWYYDTNNAPDVFKIYTSTNLSLPLTNWTLVGTVSGGVTNATISNIPYAQSWYFVTASNWWGESVPSNLAGTPQPPGPVNNLHITK